MNELEVRILGALIGVVMIAVGSVLSTDFRGTLKWCARMNVRSLNPWRSLSSEAVDSRVEGYMLLGRIVGVLMIFGGSIALIVSCVALLG